MSRRNENLNSDIDISSESAEFLSRMPGTFAHFALQYGHTTIDGEYLRLTTSDFFASYTEAWEKSRARDVLPNQEVVYLELGEAHADMGYVRQEHTHKK